MGGGIEMDELVVFGRKKAPTRVKHFVLTRCLDAWGGIITNSNREIRFCFVDALCGSGLYQLDDDDPAVERPDTYEMGSALLGPECLLKAVAFAKSRGRQVKAKAMLINKERAELETVKQALSKEVRESISIETRLQRFDEIKDELIAYCNNWFSFVLIDPYGPTPTPFAAVRDVVRGKFTDTLINFPFLSLLRWSGYLFKQSLTARENDCLLAADAFMGGTEWRGLARRSKSTGEDLEPLLIEHYKASLRREGVYVLALPLLFEDKYRVLYHLVFTTHNVAGLAAAKKSFLQANDAQIRLRDDLRLKKTGNLSFGFMLAGEPEVDYKALGQVLVQVFRGQSASIEDVILRGLEEPGVLDSDVKKALTHLRKDGRATSSGTSYGSIVEFKSE